MLGLKKKVYLDYNATSYVCKKVRRSMRRALKHSWYNPSAGYRGGKIAAQKIEKAREQVASSLNAHSHEIYFTSCATESNNTILKSLSNQFYPKKKKIISTPIEHPSVINTLEFLKAQGIIVEYCKVDNNGFVLLDDIEQLIDNDTFLICCLLANNEIGSIQNVKAVSELAKKNEILCLSDCVQALGKIPVDVKELGVDYATFSAHKLYGPKGIGAIYAKITAPMVQLIHGGHQEEGLRAGTESIHNIVGFGIACKQVNKLLSYSDKMSACKQFFISELWKIKPDIAIYSPTDDCLTNTISIRIPGIGNKELMMMLDYQGIAVSSGSACSTQVDKPSHVLKAIGLTDEETEETIRVSLGKDTSYSELRYTIKCIKAYLKEEGNNN